MLGVICPPCLFEYELIKRNASRNVCVFFVCLFEHDNLLLFGTCGDTPQQKDCIHGAPLRLLSRFYGVVVTLCAKTRALHDFDI